MSIVYCSTSLLNEVKTRKGGPFAIAVGLFAAGTQGGPFSRELGSRDTRTVTPKLTEKEQRCVDEQ